MTLSLKTLSPIIFEALLNSIVKLEWRIFGISCSMITIALPKGALLEDSISIFKKVGLDFSDALKENNRSLTFESKCKRAKALLVRNGDVPVYVSYGQADFCLLYTSDAADE